MSGLVGGRGALLGTYIAEQVSGNSYDLVSASHADQHQQRRPGSQQQVTSRAAPGSPGSVSSSCRRQQAVKCTVLPALTTLDPLLVEADGGADAGRSAAHDRLCEQTALATATMVPSPFGEKDTTLEGGRRRDLETRQAAQAERVKLASMRLFRGMPSDCSPPGTAESTKSAGSGRRRGKRSHYAEPKLRDNDFLACIARPSWKHFFSQAMPGSGARATATVSELTCDGAASEGTTTVNRSLLQFTRPMTGTGGSACPVPVNVQRRHKTYQDLFRAGLAGTEMGMAAPAKKTQNSLLCGTSSFGTSRHGLPRRKTKQFCLGAEPMEVLPEDAVEAFFQAERAATHDARERFASVDTVDMDIGTNSLTPCGAWLPAVAPRVGGSDQSSAAQVIAAQAVVPGTTIQPSTMQSQPTPTICGTSEGTTGKLLGGAVPPSPLLIGPNTGAVSSTASPVAVAAAVVAAPGEDAAAASPPENCGGPSQSFAGLKRPSGLGVGELRDPGDADCSAGGGAVTLQGFLPRVGEVLEAVNAWSRISPIRREACQLLRLFVFGSVGNEMKKGTKEKEKIYYENIGTQDKVKQLHYIWEKLDSDGSGMVELPDFKVFVEQCIADPLRIDVEVQQQPRRNSTVKSQHSGKECLRLPSLGSGTQEDIAKFGHRLYDRMAELMLGRKSPLTVEDLMRIIWPCSQALDLRTMRAWCDGFSLASARWRVPTPKVLPAAELEALSAVFAHFDKDCSGTVTAEELVHSGLLDRDQAQRYLCEVDTKGHDEVNLAEFCEMLCPTGFRATDSSDTGTDSIGQRLVYDSRLGGWREEDANVHLPSQI